MNRAITLLLGVHAHQPVGNFSEVIAEAHRRCYRPFLETLFDYPAFHFSAHFSGWLLDWLREKFPADMKLLAEMVQRGQVEMFSSGDTEPLLAAIPQRDRIGQLRTLNNKLTAWTGIKPKGAWLTERVWEAGLVTALAATGIRYAMVDDYHFLCTGKNSAELDGYFSTEEGGTRLDIFPISEALRYRIPFSPADDVVTYLEDLAEREHVAAIYFDDIEKFGVWPETYDWVYTQGWLKTLVEGVLASPKIHTATYADFHEPHPARGVVYLPSTAYREMNEWTLPMPAASIYAQFLAREGASEGGELRTPFIRGGIWRNFLTRYPESNWMHKRMQALSSRLAKVGASSSALTDKLYRAQANDAYWHGLFGGIYLPHLRRTVWNNIIALEADLDAMDARPTMAAADFDLDGNIEILVRTPHVQLALRDDGLAAVHELSSYPLHHNFGDTLRRHRECYHETVGNAPPARPTQGIASAHDLVRSKHPIASTDLVPDTHPRALWLDALDGRVVGDYQLVIMEQTQFQRDGVTKRYSLTENTVTVRWHFVRLAGRSFTTTLNLAMPSCDGTLGRYLLPNGTESRSFGQPLTLRDTFLLTLDDELLGGQLHLSASRPLEISCRPHKTVSRSEAGFEKIMQAAEVTFACSVQAEDCTLELTLSIEPHHHGRNDP